MAGGNEPTWRPLSEDETAAVAIAARSSLRSKPSLRTKTIVRCFPPGTLRLPTNLAPEEKLNTLRIYKVTYAHNQHR